MGNKAGTGCRDITSKADSNSGSKTLVKTQEPASGSWTGTAAGGGRNPAVLLVASSRERNWPTLGVLICPRVKADSGVH